MSFFNKLFVLSLLLSLSLDSHAGQAEAYEEGTKAQGLVKPITPSCFGKTFEKIEVKDLDQKNQINDGLCFSFSTASVLEMALHRRSGGEAKNMDKLSPYFGACQVLSRETPHEANARVVNPLRGERGADGGQPLDVLLSLIDSPDYPKTGTESAKALEKFINDYNKTADILASKTRIALEEKRINSEYFKWKERLAELETINAQYAEQEKDFTKYREQDFFLARHGKNKDGYFMPGDLKYLVKKDQEEAERVNKDQKKRLEFARKNFQDPQWFEKSVAVSTEMTHLIEKLKNFDELQPGIVAMAFGEEMCAQGKCFGALLAELKNKYPKDFVRVDGFKYLPIEGSNSGVEGCNPTIVAESLTTSLCLGIPVLARDLPMGKDSPVDKTYGGGVNLHNEDDFRFHSTVLKGIQRDENGKYSFTFHNSWGSGGDLRVPAEEICSAGSFFSVVDTQAHKNSGELRSEYSVLLQALAHIRGIGLDDEQDKYLKRAQTFMKKRSKYYEFKELSPPKPSPQKPQEAAQGDLHKDANAPK